jgi:hypothetical protein
MLSENGIAFIHSFHEIHCDLHPRNSALPPIQFANRESVMVFEGFEMEDLGFRREYQILGTELHAKEDIYYRLLPRSGVDA